MKIARRTIETFKLTELDALDPITVHLDEASLGEGKITIEIFGKSWSYYWGAMGNKTITQFFVTDASYIVNCLWDHTQQSSEDDYSGLTDLIRKKVLSLRREEFIAKELARTLYNVTDWQRYVPEHSYDTWNLERMYELSESDLNDCDFIQELEIPTCYTSDFKYLTRIVLAVQEAFKQTNLENTND